MKNNTKTIVIGSFNDTSKKNPICFTYYLPDAGIPFTIRKSYIEPNKYAFIELICLNYGSGFDLMFAYDDPNQRKEGVLFIGKWNDGVVESED